MEGEKERKKRKLSPTSDPRRYTQTHKAILTTSNDNLYEKKVSFLTL